MVNKNLTPSERAELDRKKKQEMIRRSQNAQVKGSHADYSVGNIDWNSNMYDSGGSSDSGGGCE